MSQSTYSVYIHTTPDGKKYIGSTRQNPIYRWRRGGGYKGNTRFHKAILQYGWDEISHEVVASGMDHDTAMNMEIELISKYHTQDHEFGFNVKNGGQSFGDHSDEFIKNIKDRMKGNKYSSGRKMGKYQAEALRKANVGSKNPSKYKGIHIHTDKTKKIISEKAIERWKDPEKRKRYMESLRDVSGEKNPRYGSKLSDETKQKIREKAIGRKVSAETRLRESQSSAGKRKVTMLDLNGNSIKTFDSIKEAAKYLNATSTNITFACRHRERTYKKYKWRYADDNS